MFGGIIFNPQRVPVPVPENDPAPEQDPEAVPEPAPEQDPEAAPAPAPEQDPEPENDSENKLAYAEPEHNDLVYLFYVTILILLVICKYHF